MERPHPASERRDPGAGHRLVLVVGAVVFVDTLFYAVIAPLLPQLAHELHLSKLSAGVMTASYPIGTLFGSLPGGALAVRAGPRPTVCAGLALLACSTIAFAFFSSAPLLDAARFVEGVGGAFSWAGGIAWLVNETPPDQRGATIGRALAAAIGGSLFGPVVGTIASATGRPAAFSAVAVIAVVLIGATLRLPSRHQPSGQRLSALLGTLRRPSIALGMWLVTLPAIASGVVNVLGPLRLHQFGAATAVIGATYLLASGLEAIVSPIVGGLSDRHGRLFPMRFGLAGAIVVLASLGLPHDWPLVAVLIVAMSGALGAFWAPAMALLSDAAEAFGLDQALAAALVNLAWAGGQILGSGGGGAIAKAAGDAVPLVTVAALCALTLLGLGGGTRVAQAPRASPTSASDAPKQTVDF
jgi:predicted MFS family arabinose efflux permease